MIAWSIPSLGIPEWGTHIQPYNPRGGESSVMTPNTQPDRCNPCTGH